MKKTIILALASLSTLAASAAFAESFGDRARVVSSRPVYERIPVSREECWNENQRGYEERRVTRSDTGAPIGAGTVLGAVVGGVLGHQVGNGRGNDAATVAGAVVGGLVGNQVERDRRGNPVTTEVERVPVDRTVERCRTVSEVRDATVGYDVQYEYAGRRFTTRLPRDPGPFVRIRVDLQAVADGPEPPPHGPRPPSYR
jgi:uncharacterized protein YcfJ